MEQSKHITPSTVNGELGVVAQAEESTPNQSAERRAFTWNDVSGSAQEEANSMQQRSRRRYIISRPRVMQYAYKGQIVRSQESASLDEADRPFQGIDEPTVRSRERLDLFIDLIWVGIISNISEAFSSKAFASEDGSSSDAFVLYLVVFLPSWRIWNGVREIINSYYR